MNVSGLNVEDDEDEDGRTVSELVDEPVVVVVATGVTMRGRADALGRLLFVLADATGGVAAVLVDAEPIQRRAKRFIPGRAAVWFDDAIVIRCELHTHTRRRATPNETERGVGMVG